MSTPPRYEDDTDLIRGCAARDAGAWERFVEKYSRLVYKAIADRAAQYNARLSCQEVRDIRQDIFSDLWRRGRLSEISRAASLPYWLVIVAGNGTIDYLRRTGRERSRMAPPQSDQEDHPAEDDIPSHGPDPSEEAAKNELHRAIEDALESLPGTEKLILKLALFHKKRYEEIAEMLHMPLGTVASHIRRGKNHLQSMLKRFYDDLQ